MAWAGFVYTVSDVSGAYRLGGVILAAIIQFYRWGKKRFFVHQPVLRNKPNLPSIEVPVDHRENPTCVLGKS